MLEVHGVLVDDPLPHVVEPVSLDPVEGLRLVRAEVEGNLGQAGACKANEKLKHQGGKEKTRPSHPQKPIWGEQC